MSNSDKNRWMGGLAMIPTIIVILFIALLIRESGKLSITTEIEIENIKYLLVEKDIRINSPEHMTIMSHMENSYINKTIKTDESKLAMSNGNKLTMKPNNLKSKYQIELFSRNKFDEDFIKYTKNKLQVVHLSANIDVIKSSDMIAKLQPNTIYLVDRIPVDLSGDFTINLGSSDNIFNGHKSISVDLDYLLHKGSLILAVGDKSEDEARLLIYKEAAAMSIFLSKSKSITF